MQHPAAVRVGERLAHPLEHLEEVRQVVGRVLAGGELRVEGLPVHQLHREERPRVGQLAQLVHRDHTGVLEHPGDARLLDEPLAEAGPAGVHLEQQFDGHVAGEVGVAGGEDGAHPAAGDLAVHREPADERGQPGVVAGRGVVRRGAGAKRKSVRFGSEELSPGVGLRVVGSATAGSQGD